LETVVAVEVQCHLVPEAKVALVATMLVQILLSHMLHPVMGAGVVDLLMCLMVAIHWLQLMLMQVVTVELRRRVALRRVAL
jgi:hypothetical protein